MDLDYLPQILIVPISSRTGKDIHPALFWDYPIEGEEAIESFMWSLTFPTQFTTKKRNLVIIRGNGTHTRRERNYLTRYASDSFHVHFPGRLTRQQLNKASV